MAVNNISRILNSKLSDINTNKVNAVQDEFNSVSSRLLGKQYFKYNDLESLQASGLSTKFNNLQKSLVNLSAYQVVNTNTSLKLDTQERLLGDLTKIMHELPGKMEQVDIDLNQTCNEALAKIQVMLNTRDAGGEYLFGGVNSLTPPCNVDLTLADNTNVVNGQITTNYTDAVPNVLQVSVSDQNTVSVGIDASNDAFVQAIGYINLLKTHINADNPIKAAQEDQVAEAARKESLELTEKLITQVRLTKETLKVAQQYNRDLEVSISEDMQINFLLSQQELAVMFKDAYQNLMLAQQAQITSTKLLDRLLQMV